MQIKKTHAVGGLLAALPWLALAQGELTPLIDVERDFLAGGSLALSTVHVGQSSTKVDFKPMFGFRLGRFRVARSRANVLMNTGRDAFDTGVSTDVFEREPWKVSAALKIDNGRSFEADPQWRGLPDIETTLRLRLSARRPLTDRWSVSISADQDILGRNGGSRLSGKLGYRHPVSEHAHWDLSLSSGWGDRRYMNTHYGIPEAVAPLVRTAAYSARSGLESLQVGWDYSRALSDNWVLYGGVALSRLTGTALHSPLVNRSTTYGLTMGLVWRSSAD